MTDTEAATGERPCATTGCPAPMGHEGDCNVDTPREDPRPDGEYLRVEIMGHDVHTGWVTEGTRAGVAVLVIRDWDNRVIAEVPGQSLYRIVPLPTPLTRPAVRQAITVGDGYYGDPEGPF